MFTGIIEELGTVKRVQKKAQSFEVTLNCQKMQTDLKIGDSIACNGICLTVISFKNSSVSFEAMHETALKTNLVYWKNASLINMERALQLGGRLDGHLVQGHVDTMARVLSINKQSGNCYVEIAYQASDSPLLILHGSVAINGVSLTIARLSARSFTVSLITHSYQNTNFHKLASGELVNVEFDIIGKYIQRSTATQKTISQDWLLKNNF